jgi:hypothetical protein
MSQIVYLSYGRGHHELEVVFSLMSALEVGGNKSFDIVIYAEHPEAFNGIPAEIRPVTKARWQEWSGPHDFKHRCKIEVLRDAMQSRCVKSVLLDGDTWWKRSPDHLFSRIGPRRSVMHICEGRLDRMGMPKADAMAEFLDGRTHTTDDGTVYEFSGHNTIWNAGVVGLDPSDAHLLDEVLSLTDSFCGVSRLHVLEQFAFTAVLGRRTRLGEAADLVFHYWPPYLHDPFRLILPSLMNGTKALPIHERATLCYRQRPRPDSLRICKVIAKRTLQSIGLIGPGCRTSEW